MNKDGITKERRSAVPHRTMLMVFLGALVCLALLQAGPACAEEEKYPDRLMFRLGGYSVSNADTMARLDANNAPAGVYIDFNKTLGVETTTTVARLDGLYRFNDHHGLGFAWYALKFTGSRDLLSSVTSTINWGGVELNDTRLNTEVRFDVYKMNYQYSVFHNEQAELGALFGFHIMKTFVGIEAVGIGSSKNSAITAPLPVLGLYADYHFSPRLSAYYNLQFFSINYEDKVKGAMQDFLLGLEYRLWKNVALGVAYNKFAVKLELVGDATTLTLNTNWNGGMLYGSLYF